MKRIRLTGPALIHLGIVLCIVAGMVPWLWQPPAVSAAPAVLEYFALGDSIASGHGLLDDNSGCRRSSRAYPYKVKSRLQSAGYSVNLHHLACSGATTLSFHNQVVSALDSIESLPAATPKLVSITIGANDFNWAGEGSIKQHLYDENFNAFSLWVAGVHGQVSTNVYAELNRLIKQPNVVVSITDVYNPFNPTSVFFNPYHPLLFPDDSCWSPQGVIVQYCYGRTVYAVGQLNEAISGAVSNLS